MPKSKQSEKCEEKILNVVSKSLDEQKIVSSENTGLLTSPLLDNSQSANLQSPQPVAGAPTDKKRTDPKSSETVPPGNKLKTPKNPLSQNNNNLTSQTSDLPSLQLYGSSQISDQKISSINPEFSNFRPTNSSVK